MYNLLAFLAFVASLMAVVADHFTWIKAAGKSAPERRGCSNKKGTIPCNVTWLAATITDRTIQAVPCQMPRLPAIVARLLIGAINSQMPRPITIVT
jgi:hypothetical protein